MSNRISNELERWSDHVMCMSLVKIYEETFKYKTSGHKIIGRGQDGEAKTGKHA